VVLLGGESGRLAGGLNESSPRLKGGSFQNQLTDLSKEEPRSMIPGGEVTVSREAAPTHQIPLRASSSDTSARAGTRMTSNESNRPAAMMPDATRNPRV
jgi:hypothetical protein